MARPSSFSLQIGKAVSQSFAIYFRNFVPFTVLSVLVYLPWLFFYGLAIIPLQAEMVSGSGPRDAAAALGMMAMGAALLSMLLQYILIGAVTFGVVQQLRGEPAALGEAVSQGLRSLGRILLAGLWVGCRVILFMLLLIIPGIWEAVRLQVAIPAAVMEGAGPGGAVARSIALTKGSRWQVFGALVVAWLLAMLVGMALGAVGGGILGASGNMDMVAWIEPISTVMFAPFGAVIPAVIYFMLREGKEGADLDEVAAVFA